MSDTPVTPVTSVTGIDHVRLSVTDIRRSKQFYQHLLGVEPAFDMTDKIDEPGILENQEQLFGGCGFPIGDNQLLGLRPVGASSDRFDPTRVGLDHLSLSVGSTDDLKAAAERLTAAGIEHGDYQELTDVGMAIVSVQDPDDINIELTVRLSD